jgi:hypothetical protein
MNSVACIEIRPNIKKTKMAKPATTMSRVPPFDPLAPFPEIQSASGLWVGRFMPVIVSLGEAGAKGVTGG